MATKIVTPKIDICEVVFGAIESQLPDAGEEYSALLNKLRPLIEPELFDQIDSAGGYRLYHAQQAAFRLGWALRSEVL